MKYDDVIHGLLRERVEVETHAYLWHPDDGIDFTPCLADKVFGDGLALLCLFTLNSRPAYYVVRIGSDWSFGDWRAPDGAPDVHEFIDDICEALSNQFGDVDYLDEDDGADADDRGWPVFDYGGGCSWGRMDWPQGFAVDPHPFAPTWTVLNPVRVQPPLQPTHQTFRVASTAVLAAVNGRAA